MEEERTNRSVSVRILLLLMLLQRIKYGRPSRAPCDAPARAAQPDVAPAYVPTECATALALSGTYTMALHRGKARHL